MIYCISDLHIGDKSRKDDFQENERKLIEFLQSIPDKNLIMVGDIFELWQCHLDNVIMAYPDLIRLLLRKSLCYVIGNHDQDMLNMKLLFGVPIVDKLIIEDTLFVHGHQFDAVNSKYKRLGRSITKMAGWLEEYIHKDVDVWAEQLVMRLKKLGRFGFPEHYRKEAVKQAKKEDMKRIVIGHSHVEDYAKIDGVEYYNCGTWTNGRQHVVKI